MRLFMFSLFCLEETEIVFIFSRISLFVVSSVRFSTLELKVFDYFECFALPLLGQFFCLLG